MSQKGAQRPFIGPRLPSGPSKTAGQVNQIDVDSIADQSPFSSLRAQRGIQKVFQ